MMNAEQKSNKRLDNYSSIKFSITRNKAQKFIEEGKILVNNMPSKSSYKLKEEDVVVFLGEIEEEIDIKPVNIPIDIIYEDVYLIVLNKQKGLICHPTAHNKNNTLVNALLYHTKGKLSNIGGNIRQGIVHRLDCNTSGLMMAAKTNEAHIKLQEDIKTKKTIRKYRAIVHGIINEDNGVIDKPLVHYMGKTVKMNVSDVGLEAVTEYKVLERFKKATYLELNLKTGRTHQIRCHLAYLNHPVVGDELYGSKGFCHITSTKGQVLQSYYLSFTHPITDEIMNFEIEEDDDTKRVLKILRSEA